MQQILQAVAYCHSRRVAHRDLKPENFLFLNSSPWSALKLIDFGLAARYTPGEPLRTKAGTPYYVSPQVLEGRYGPECDVWSAGVIMYILLCGYPPFNSYSDRGIMTKVSPRTLLSDSRRHTKRVEESNCWCARRLEAARGHCATDPTRRPLHSSFSQVKAAEVTFPMAEWNSVSAEAKQLIDSLLVKNPRQRATAEQVSRWLSHSPPRVRPHARSRTTLVPSTGTETSMV